MEDLLNCPYCEAEAYGHTTGWGFSPEGWEQMWEVHRRRHIPPVDSLEPLEIDCSAL